MRFGECGVNVIALVMFIYGANWLLAGCVVGSSYLVMVIIYFYIHHESAIWSPTKSKQFAALNPPESSEGHITPGLALQADNSIRCTGLPYFSAFVSAFFQMFAVIEDFEPLSNTPADTRIYSCKRFVDVMREIVSDMREPLKGSEIQGPQVLAAAQELVQRIHPNFFCNRAFVEKVIEDEQASARVKDPTKQDKSHIFDYRNYDRGARQRETSDQALPMPPQQANLLSLARKLVEQLTVLYGTPEPDDKYAAAFCGTYPQPKLVPLCDFVMDRRI